MVRLALAGVLPVLFAAAAGAQDPPIVTEAEFLSALGPSHPAVVASAEARAVAEAGVLEASTFENPELGAVREDPEGAIRQTDWTLSWQLPRPDRGPRVEARREAAAAADASYSQRLVTLRLAMREVYAAWALAAEREERLAARAGRVEALAAREAARAERGEASGLEARRLALAASGLRSRVDLASAERERARAEAAAWSPDLPPEARPALPPLPPAPELGTPHPAVRAAEAELAAAQLEREAAGRVVASPSVALGWQRQEAGPDAVEGPILGIGWSIPLFDRNRAEKAASDARVAGARARLDLARREIAAAREAARAVFERLATGLRDAEAALADTRRMLDGAESAFRQGETTLTDLLDTHRVVTDGELAALDLHEAALAAHRELERLAGAPAEIDPPSHPEPQEQIP